MGALVTRIIGSAAAKYITKETAMLILKKYGPRILTQVVQGVGKQGIKNLTIDELLLLAKKPIFQAAEKEGMSAAKLGIRKAVRAVDKKIDVLDDLLQNWASRRALRPVLSKNFGPPGGSPFMKPAGNKAQEVVDEVFARVLAPENRKQAFFLGFVKGSASEGLATGVSNSIKLLIGGPRGIVMLPRLKAVLKVGLSEWKRLRMIGDITTADKLARVLRIGKQAYDAAGVSGGTELLGFEVLGNFSGRLTVVGATQYVFVSDEQRRKNINKFKKSIKVYAKKRVTVHVNAYTRQDGTRVQGYNRTMVVSR